MARVRKPIAFGLAHDAPPASCNRLLPYPDESEQTQGCQLGGSKQLFSIYSSNAIQEKMNMIVRQRRSNRITSVAATADVLANRCLPTDGWQARTDGSFSRSTISHRLRRIPKLSTLYSLLLFVVLLSRFTSGSTSNQPDAEHLTAMVGDSIVFNCHIEFPEAHPVPYVIQWEKKGVEIPFFIWYETYLHTSEDYEGRVSRVAQQEGSHYGLASLNLTKIRESDQGWYLCLVNFLNRSPRQDKNGTLFHLNVHAPPRFTLTPDDVVYVSLGDPIILSCLAEGTPAPEILWYRDSELVHTSISLAVTNDGTELRISNIRQDEIGDYTCVAKNGQGTVRHTTKLVTAGGAVIIVPPMNVTRLEGEQLEMPCEARGLPGNFSVTWLRENHAVRSIPWLEARTQLKKDGTLTINPVHSDDRGQYSCEVTNGIGEPQRASAFVEIEYPARVTFTPTVQYLPLRLSGVVRCHVEAHPPFQFITWTKDKRIFDPFETPNVGVLKNGSLFFEKVTPDNQGRYTCTPYNVHGTAGSSAVMEVLVREPPTFVTRPQSIYQHKVDDDVQMACEAQGTPSPRITWRRMDGRSLPRERTREEAGVLTLSKLRRTDFGYYECHVSNEVATLIATAHLIIEGTTPHAPYNITTDSTEFSVSLDWLPGYSGGSDYSQHYVIWYRQEGASQWIPVDVDPPTSTKTEIHNLQSGTTYEFQVIGKNVLGDGMFSNIVKERTKGITPPDPAPPGPSRATTSTAATANEEIESNHEFRKYNEIVYPTDARGSTYIPTLFRPTGPPPIAPENVTVTDASDGVLLTWSYPRRGNIVVAYFTIDYAVLDEQWKRLNKQELKPTETSYLVKNLNVGKTYMFRVNSHTLTSIASSEKVTYVIQRKIKDKAITAGIVGGILFFIVAIILAVCTVKCVNKRNKRRRREQEKAYSMVACQVTESRNGSQSVPTKSVPSRKGWTSRLPSLSDLPQLKRGVASIRQALQLNSTHQNEPNQPQDPGTQTNGDEVDGIKKHGRAKSNEAADWLEYGAAELQLRSSKRSKPIARYNVQAEFLEPSGWISRSADGKFVSVDEGARQIRSGFGYSFAHNSAIEIESGVYRIGGDRLVWPRPQPILRREMSPVPPLGPKPLSRGPNRYLSQSTSSGDPSYAQPLHADRLVTPEFSRHHLSPNKFQQQPTLATTMISGGLQPEMMRSSSPGAGLLFSPSLANFSDMSSVRQTSSIDRSYPRASLSRLSSSQLRQTPEASQVSDGQFNRFFPETVALTPSVSHSRYTRELPALLPIHQQLAVHQRSHPFSPPPPPPQQQQQQQQQMRTVRAEVHSNEVSQSGTSTRVQSEFGLLLNTAGRHFHAPPPFRPPPPPPAYQRIPYGISYPPSSSQRPLATSSPPRTRTSQSLAFRVSTDEAGTRRRRSPLTIAVRLSPARTQKRPNDRGRSQIVEYSPQSQSSSSGFDSKNTSQQNQSSQSGSGHSHLLGDSSSSANWETLRSMESADVAGREAESTYVNWPVKALGSGPVLSLLDASVDNHYEFDTTQSPNETGQEHQLPSSSTRVALDVPPTPPSRSGTVTIADSSGSVAGRHRKSGPAQQARSENIEARVQAMKEEFQEYRKRRARGLLESAC